MQFSFATLALLPLISTALAAPTALEKRTNNWLIRKFTRDCTNPNSCIYNFVIDTQDSLSPCTIVDNATPATTHAWYGVFCSQNPNWRISWGWDYAGDFTVMTTVYVPTQMEAFFGYSHPNAVLPISTYADVGPNAIQPTGA